jgi:hypothetical protein
MNSGPPQGLTLVCPRVPVSRVRSVLPARYLETLERNQKIATCCRHADDHDVEAWRSSPSEPSPDVYVFICRGCGRRHSRFCVGEIDRRPAWGRALR